MKRSCRCLEVLILQRDSHLQGPVLIGGIPRLLMAFHAWRHHSCCIPGTGAESHLSHVHTGSFQSFLQALFGTWLQTLPPRAAPSPWSQLLGICLLLLEPQAFFLPCSLVELCVWVGLKQDIVLLLEAEFELDSFTIW